MFERIWRMLVKEFIQVFRDPRMRPVIFVVPIIQLVVFGYAVTTDVNNVTLAVRDMDHSVASRELISRFTGSGYFTVNAYPQTDLEASELLDRGKVQAIIRIDQGFDGDLRSGRSALLQMILDGTDSNTARIALQYASNISDRYSREIILERTGRTTGAAPSESGIEMQPRAWFNENLESRNFYVPGVIATLLALITLMLTSMAIVREKEIGTMEQIMVTPIRPIEFILGKTLPFAAIGLFDVVLVTLVGVFWFEVPIRGSLVLLLFSTLLYLMTTLGIGLLISTLSGTQQQAMMTTFFFFMPALLLSGLMFPIANMPVVVQWITFLNPLRYFLVIVRGIFLKGVGIEVLWTQMAALAAIGLATLAIASGRLKKTFA